MAVYIYSTISILRRQVQKKRKVYFTANKSYSENWKRLGLTHKLSLGQSQFSSFGKQQRIDKNASRNLSV